MFTEFLCMCWEDSCLPKDRKILISTFSLRVFKRKDVFLLQHSSDSFLVWFFKDRSRHPDHIQDTWRIFNTEWLKAKTKVMKSLILYCDDCAVVTHAVDDLQRLTDPLSVTTKHFWTYNKHQKTEVMFQSTKGSTTNMPETKINCKVSWCRGIQN